MQKSYQIYQLYPFTVIVLPNTESYPFYPIIPFYQIITFYLIITFYQIIHFYHIIPFYQILSLYTLYAFYNCIPLYQIILVTFSRSPSPLFRVLHFLIFFFHLSPSSIWVLQSLTRDLTSPYSKLFEEDFFTKTHLFFVPRNPDGLHVCTIPTS